MGYYEGESSSWRQKLQSVYNNAGKSCRLAERVLPTDGLIFCLCVLHSHHGPLSVIVKDEWFDHTIPASKWN